MISLKVWQKISIVSVFVLFIILRGGFLLSCLKDFPVKVTQKQRARELSAACKAYAETMGKIKNQSCTVVDFRSGQVVINNAWILFTGYHQERDSVSALSRSLVAAYSKIDPRYIAATTTPVGHHLDGVPAQKGWIDSFDCKKVALFFVWIFPINFLPFIILLILIKRWYYSRPWQFSFGDVVVIILCHLTGTFAFRVYTPNNFLQKRIDSQLKIWKDKIGAHGWRLALAYLVAIIVSLATLIRPAKSQAQMVVETKIVSLVPAAAIVNQQEKESNEPMVFFPEKVVGFLRRVFEEIMIGIETVVYKTFSFMITQFFSPPLEFIWGLWARPPDEMRFWITRALGSRAPADFVLVSNSLKTWTKKITGVNYENQNIFDHLVGTVCCS